MSGMDKNGLSEAEFLASYDSSKYEHPSVTADIALFAVSSTELDNYRKLPEKQLEILLIKRGGHPYLGKWALPGGFLKPGETLDQAAYRELKEETGVDSVYLEQLFGFSDPDRDPRGWIITESFLALADKRKLSLQAGDDADEAAWFTVSLTSNEQSVWTLKLVGQNLALKATLTEATTAKSKSRSKGRSAQTHITTGREASPLVAIDSDLAFDHASIISYAIERMRNKVDYTGLAFSLLPKQFTLTDLQQVYELILGKELLTPAFRRKIANYVIATDEFTQNAGHRPSRLYMRRDENEKNTGILE
ncbi:ADP-ribose pyrophosphatase [Actinomycetota bacterium]|nr:ADP-ribose pyrophosphatase [Actinomycetota bacterium]